MHYESVRSVLASAIATLLVLSATTPANGVEAPGRGAEGASVSTAGASGPVSSFTLEEMIQGIVFANGVVAESLGRVVSYPSGLTEEERAIVREVESRITASMISANGPALTSAFPEITSGDPYRVQSALKVFSTSFKAALDREYPGASDTLVIAPRCGAVAVCAAVAVAVVALGAAIAAVTFNVAGAVNMIYNQNGLWNKNGVFNGKEAPRASDPTELVQNYPTLSASEEVRRITVALRSA